MILGTLWNVVDIKKIIFETKQYRLQDFLIGILFGATLSFFLIILGGGKYLVIPENDTWQNLFLLIFQISVAEELLFRGFTLKYLQGFNLNPIFSNLIQSLTFTLLHTSRYTSNFIILSVVFLSGYIAGYFTIKNNNIFIAIVIHVTVNLVSGIYLTINFI
jgi:membrane protease YdiL (CAAX protease family)